MYQELKKVKRSSYYGQLISETVVAVEAVGNTPAKTFTNTHSDTKVKDGFTRLIMSKNYGAGVEVTFQKLSKRRMYQWFISLGKSDLELLKFYIEQIEGEMKEYDGQFEPVELDHFK